MYHFVLVHGGCHGAWCWFKLTDRLQNAGHKVTAIDLATSVTRPRDANTITTFSEYHQPLMEFLDSLPDAQLEAPDAEKVSQISSEITSFATTDHTLMLVTGSEMTFCFCLLL